MPTIELSTALRGAAANRSRVAVDAATVGQALQALCLLHPALRGHLFSDLGTLKRSVGVFVGEDDVRSELGLQRALRPDEVVVLIAAMAGG